MRAPRRRAGRLLALLLVSGCVQSFDSTTLGVPVTMGAAPGEAPEGTAFKTNSHSIHAFWGLLSLSKPSLQKALARQLVGGQSVAQLKIKTRSSWSDVLFTVLTVGLLAPRTITYEGMIIGR